MRWQLELLRSVAIGVGLAAGPGASLAQAPPAVGTEAGSGQPASPAASAPAAKRGDGITTLGEVRALAPDQEAPVDLYRFRNPVQVPPNAFDRAYRPPPSVKEVSEAGGYVMLGINALAGAVAKGLSRLGPGQVQAAVARPPPALDAAQLRRARAMCAASAQCAPDVPSSP